jgi:hypothetical protein
MKFADRVKKLVDEAPVITGRGPNVNFGPVTFTPIVLKWQGRGAGAKPIKTPLDDYMEEHNIDEDDDLVLADGEELQLHVDIDITELNPSLGFHYERDVALLASNKSNKDPKKWVLTDWSETVLPSIEKVFGKDWEKKVFPNGKKAAPTLYVAAESVDSLKPVKEGKKNAGTPKFIAVYEDLEACRAARDLRYPPRDEAEEMAFGPEGDGGAEGGFPEEALDQARELFKSNKKNKKQTIKMLTAVFEDEGYDAEELFAAALPDA